MSDLAAALQIAIKVHADQRDKQGEPYLLHVLRVVEAVSDEAKVVAALHDVLEDQGNNESAWTGVQIAGDCLLSPVELRALEYVTRQPNASYQEYVERIADGANTHFGGRSLAREVKLADLRDNLGRIPTEPHPIRSAASVRWDREWASLKARYEKAIAILEATQ